MGVFAFWYNLQMKVALVHDWLVSMRGGERVLEVLCELFPDAPIFTLLHVPGSTSKTIESHTIFTSFLQKLPRFEKYYRYTYPLMPMAIEAFNFSGYDLVISTSHRIAKGIIVPTNTCHISYIHSPMRDAWEFTNEYFGKQQMSWWKRAVIPPQLTFLRTWDVLSTPRVDALIANSHNVQNRIYKTYRRKSTVIYPPVDTSRYIPSDAKEDYYFMVGSFEPNKRVHLAIDAFTELGYPLKIVSGSGRKHNELLSRAGKNIEFLGWQDDDTVAKLFAHAKAFVFPGLDDFGITPVEAQACGTPVVAFGQGGALETVIDGKSGVLFYEPTADALAEAVRRVESIEWDTHTLVQNARRFDRTSHADAMKRFIFDTFAEFQSGVHTYE